MKDIIKDNAILLWASLSLILLGSILLGIFAPTNKEKIISTEIYTTDTFNYNSIINRVERVEVSIKDIKKILSEQNEEIIFEPEVVEEKGTTVEWPLKFKFNLKSPSSL